MTTPPPYTTTAPNPPGLTAPPSKPLAPPAPGGHWYGFNSWVDDPKQVLIRTFLATAAQAKALQAAGLKGFFHQSDAGSRANAYQVKDLTPAQLTLVNKTFGTHYIASGQQNQKINIPIISPIANALTGLDAVGNFFNKLGEGATWKRIAEFVLGAALVIIGMVKLAAGTPAGKTATGIATKAALA